jgi:putative ABC transport system permease protein
MIQNYFKIAWRNLLKNKTFSFINIMGLALGITCSLIILLWVQDEISIDAFHAQSKNLYTVYERQYFDGRVEAKYNTPALMADEMKKVVPEIENACSVDYNNRQTFEVEGKKNKMEGIYAGIDFFKMFSYPILEGIKEDALNGTKSIAISRKMAEIYFGSPQKAIGKTIRYENIADMTVSAVFENVPSNTSKKFDYVLNWYLFIQENQWGKDWENNGVITHLQLRSDAHIENVAHKIENFIDAYNKKKTPNFQIKLSLQPYANTYLNNNFKEGKLDGGRIEHVRLFSIIAIFILLIACINFMNLATARSSKRAKEIGIRKVVGAVRTALMGQFIGEALLVTILSIVIALLFVALILPSFNTLVGKQLVLPVNQPQFLLILLGLTVFTSLIAGSYPAFFLSSFNPIRVLKGALKIDSSTVFLRKGLVTFQFALSILLIVSMIVISKQVEFVQNKNIGYDRENLIYIPLEGELFKNYPILEDELSKTGSIKSMSLLSQVPTNIGNTTGGVQWAGKDPNVNIQFTFMGVSYNFAKTMNVKFVEGRDFSRDFATDSVGFLINEAALQRIGYKNPIDQPIQLWQKKGKIIGIVKDFHFQSLHDPINPLVIYLKEKFISGNILIKTENNKTKEALAQLEKHCKELNPKFPFTYAFVDEEYAKLYKSEQLVSSLSGSFSFLAIFISCLGLFGLVVFTAEQRTKEIGIRKVLGASVTGITGLLAKDFLKLVLIAIVIASPVAYYFIQKWLADFAYRIDIQWWMFIAAGAAAVLIAFLTVGFQSVRAALANPVKSLRSE